MEDAAFHDLRQSDLPLVITVHRADNDQEVWRTEVTSLPVAVEIPAIARGVGCAVWVRLEFGDGRVVSNREEMISFGNGSG